MKNNKGITLIALVVTIIVLLILAGVSIAMLSGQNGILNRAREAREQSTKGSLDEAVKIVVGNYMTRDLQWSTLTETNKTTLETDIKAVNSGLNVTATFTAGTATVDSYFTIKATDTTGASSATQTVYLNAVTGAVTNTAPTTKTK